MHAASGSCRSHQRHLRAGQDGEWGHDKKRLYEFITRSFLATCSRPAIGYETSVDACVAGEGFHASGASLHSSRLAA